MNGNAPRVDLKDLNSDDDSSDEENVDLDLDLENENDDKDGEGSTKKQTSGPLGVSKKDNDTRRKEVLQGGLGKALVTACLENAASMLTTQHAADVLAEAAGCAILEQALGGSDGEGLNQVHAAIVEEVKKEKTDEHVALNFFGSRALRRLILLASDTTPSTNNESTSTSITPAARFVELVWTDALQGNCKRWYGTHAEKILAAVVQERELKSENSGYEGVEIFSG